MYNVLKIKFVDVSRCKVSNVVDKALWMPVLTAVISGFAFQLKVFLIALVLCCAAGWETNPRSLASEQRSKSTVGLRRAKKLSDLKY